MVDRKLIKQVVEIFVDMGGQRNSLEVYVQDFEDMLLSTTGAHAHTRARQPAPANSRGPLPGAASLSRR
jgi:hypothetical protein